MFNGIPGGLSQGHWAHGPGTPPPAPRPPVKRGLRHPQTRTGCAVRPSPPLGEPGREPVPSAPGRAGGSIRTRGRGVQPLASGSRGGQGGFFSWQGRGAPPPGAPGPRLHFGFTAVIFRVQRGADPEPGHTGQGRRPQQGRECGGTGSRFKFQPCSPVTLGRSQLKAQGSRVGPWPCPAGSCG